MMGDANYKTIDIVLLLEGTYPYVRGGVSSWVHDLILGFSNLRFYLIFLGSQQDAYDKAHYELPNNVVALESYYLMEVEENDLKPESLNKNVSDCIEELEILHDYFRQPKMQFDKLKFDGIVKCTKPNGKFQYKEFLYSKESWEFICNRYNKYAKHVGFTDYFWTVRTMHRTVFKLFEIAQKVPQSKVYHSVSTGYAGLLGALLHINNNKPFILTEHGIYTKERKIDLQSAYVKECDSYFKEVPLSGMDYHHELWVRFFHSLGRIIYKNADPIVALYDRNRLRQIKDGASSDRTMVIPNGIDLERFLPVRAKRNDENIPKVLGLIGRIVTIKDIKTFIRAMRTVCTFLPEAEGWLIGPDDEDQEYAQECHDLVASLDLENNVKFLGFQNIDEILPKLGLLVLTSISEAFPLVIVEAYASGLPVLTTDVGGCREIVEGLTEEDKRLGSAGAVVSIANPQETAEAAIDLLLNEKKWRSAQRAGILRVEKYYTKKHVITNYNDIYSKALNK
jgi:glycosyltransferase involved in cell wall biosynthesis